MLFQYAASMGMDVADIQAAAGLALDELVHADTRVPIEQLSIVWTELVRHSGDPNFGLHLGEMSNRLAVGGILFSVMMNCATVGHALEKYAAYHSLATDFVQLRLIRAGELARVVWEPADASLALDRHFTETVFCGLAFPLDWLTQGAVKPVEIHFSHAQPADTNEHKRIFGCPLVFGASQNALVLQATDLDRPVVLANAQLLDTLETHAQEMLARLYPPDTWADQVVHQINQSFTQGEKPTLEMVAGALAISPRQLQNKLKAEQVTYQALLDEVRQELALKYLRDRQITICEIAFLLGFSEQSAFNHAFKRWLDMTPGEFRATVS
jgi:AraC-like DNA-binding protein